MRKAKLGQQGIEREVERIKTLIADFVADLIPSQPTALYDSGWVLSTAGVHTFTHNLGALPTLWSLLAADDASGTDPTPMIVGSIIDGANQYGFREEGMSTTQFNVLLRGNGYAYNGSKWYQRGTDHIRFLIWATE